MYKKTKLNKEKKKGPQKHTHKQRERDTYTQTNQKHQKTQSHSHESQKPHTLGRNLTKTAKSTEMCEGHPHITKKNMKSRLK